MVFDRCILSSLLFNFTMDEIMEDALGLQVVGAEMTNVEML